MPSSEVRQRLRHRLAELYERHRWLDEFSVARCYESGRGHFRPEPNAAELDRFAIALVTVDGETYQVGAGRCGTER